MLSIAAMICTLVVAAAHLWFMVLETFLWTKPFGRKVFATSAEEAQTTKLLAANQGVYNGALAGVLVWAALSGNAPAVMALLGFVVVVGVYGGVTVSRGILVVQALPAAVALGLTVLSVNGG